MGVGRSPMQWAFILPLSVGLFLYLTGMYQMLTEPGRLGFGGWAHNGEVNTVKSHSSGHSKRERQKNGKDDRCQSACRQDSQEEVPRLEGLCSRTTRGTVSPGKVALDQKPEQRKAAGSVDWGTGRRISV